MRMKLRKEIDKRRTCMNGPGLEELKKEVGREIWGASKVKLSMQSITLCGQ
jgi:hypothetical protein